VPKKYRLRTIISFGYRASAGWQLMPDGDPPEKVLPMLGRKPLPELVFEERMDREY
jgi:hypothetical protein